MDLNARATQEVFAELVGVSQPAVAKHLKAGILPVGGSYCDWILAYCDRLRIEAGGRVPTDARERKDLAQARESEVNAALKEQELMRRNGTILDLDSVRLAMTEWISIGKNEFLGAIDRIVSAIESSHGITIEREPLQQDVDTALRAIGNYSFQSEQADQ